MRSFTPWSFCSWTSDSDKDRVYQNFLGLVILLLRIDVLGLRDRVEMHEGRVRCSDVVPAFSASSHFAV